MININPFCFNHPLRSPEEYIFRLLKGNYQKADKVVRGRPDQIIDAALANTGECNFDRAELEAALSRLQEGPGSLLCIGDEGMIEPTERFVVPEPA